MTDQLDGKPLYYIFKPNTMSYKAIDFEEFHRLIDKTLLITV